MTVFYSDDQVTLHCGDALSVLQTLPAGSADCVVTSPPYWGLRDYGVAGQYGLEPSPTAYVENLIRVFTEVARVLTPDGTLWLNLGDSYAGKANAGASVGRSRRADRAELIPPRVNATGEAPYKSLLLLPARVALGLVDAGWRVRNRIVWEKTDAMPESVTDRLSNRYEELLLLTRSDRYWFDLAAIRVPVNPDSLRRGQSWAARRARGARGRHGLTGPTNDSDFAPSPAGRNPGDVWAYPTAGFPGAHFAVMSERVAERCVLAGCKPGGVVLDPFAGTCTTGLAALRTGRRFVGVDLNPKSLDLALQTRLRQGALTDTPGDH